MKEILMSNIPASVATIGLVLYFFGMAIVFITSPLSGFDSWSGNRDPTCCLAQPKGKKERNTH